LAPIKPFLIGLGAALAAPAVIRVAPLMPISTRCTPLYVPVNWPTDEWRWDPEWAVASRGPIIPRDPLWFFGAHGWPRPLADAWINIRDCDPAFARAWGAAA
jgi:hypothetical protein